jgi:HEPN domain-containing protein
MRERLVSIIDIRYQSSAAPLVALVLLLPAPIAALNSFLKKKRRNKQKRGYGDVGSKTT